MSALAVLGRELPIPIAAKADTARSRGRDGIGGDGPMSRR